MCLKCFCTCKLFDGAKDGYFEQEWPHSSYPPWAHGPGYILSEDIATFIVQGHKDMDLMVKISASSEN